MIGSTLITLPSLIALKSSSSCSLAAFLHLSIFVSNYASLLLISSTSLTQLFAYLLIFVLRAFSSVEHVSDASERSHIKCRAWSLLAHLKQIETLQLYCNPGSTAERCVVCGSSRILCRLPGWLQSILLLRGTARNLLWHAQTRSVCKCVIRNRHSTYLHC